LASPPAIRTTPSASPTAAIAACGFVALELSRNRTPSTVATGSPRWGCGANVAIASAIAWSPIANAWAAVAAAAASARIGGESNESAPRSAPLHPAVSRPSRMPAPPSEGSPSVNHRTSHGAVREIAADASSSRFPTWTSAAPWSAKTRAFAAA
jgi:hypothetical protein